MNKEMPPFKVLVIASPKGIRSVQARLLREDNIKVECATFSNISAILSEKVARIYCKSKSIKEYDFVWLQSASKTKDIAYLLSLELDNLKIPHTNPETEITKLVDLFMLALNQVAIPKTYFYSRAKMAVRQQRLSEKLGYPFLLKSTVGLGGSDVHIVHNSQDFFNLVASLPDQKKYVCQEFIPNKFDYRVIVGNGVVLSGEKRIRQGDLYRNNAKLGAEEVFLPLDDIPQEVKDLAIKAAKVANLRWSGVDIVTSEKTGKHYVMEVNRRPGLTLDSTEVQAAMTFLRELKKTYQQKS